MVASPPAGCRARRAPARMSSPPISARSWNKMLTVEHLEAGYGPARTLFEVSFSVAAGEVVTLIGRNGMGKTTTIRTIMGLLPPVGGTVVFNGEPLVGLPPYRIAQAGLGLAPEGRQVFPTLTVEENL